MRLITFLILLTSLILAGCAGHNQYNIDGNSRGESGAGGMSIKSY